MSQASKGLVLSLFPGADLLGRAFEEVGFAVVRGPDPLWGGDARDFHVPDGRFDGVIGGPPCQFASLARHGAKREALNLIPEFLRIVNEAAPAWAVMENVRQVQRKGAAPAWPWSDVRDHDVGGFTARVRRFWFLGLPPPLTGRPMRNPRELGGALHSVLASDWHGRRRADGTYVRLRPDDAARAQGFPELAKSIMEAQPGEVTNGSRRVLAIHMLGNGVPRAMGLFIARHVAACLRRTGETFDRSGVA